MMGSTRQGETFICWDCGHQIFGWFGHSDECVVTRTALKGLRNTAEERTVAQMGMFDKDKLFAPDGPLKDWAGVDAEFILWDIQYKGTIKTDINDNTPITHLTVSAMDSPDTKKIVSMLGDNTKAMAEEAEAGELPAVCVTKIVPTKDSGKQDAFVFNWVRDYSESKGRAKAAA